MADKTPADILGGGKKKTKKPRHTVRHKETVIEHHKNGSHTVRHRPMDGGDEVSYSAPDMAAVHQGLDENVGDQAEAAPPSPMTTMPGAGAPSAGA